MTKQRIRKARPRQFKVWLAAQDCDQLYLHARARGIAFIRGVHEINTVDVGAVRQHFIGARNLKSAIAKREVLEKCRRLGFPATDHNAGDALALWHFACSLIKPELALQASPLFYGRAAE